MRYCFLYFFVFVVAILIASYSEASGTINFEETGEISNKVIENDNQIAFDTDSPSKKATVN